MRSANSISLFVIEFNSLWFGHEGLRRRRVRAATRLDAVTFQTATPLASSRLSGRRARIDAVRKPYPALKLDPAESRASSAQRSFP